MHGFAFSCARLHLLTSSAGAVQDKNADNRAAAEAKFKDVSEAYEVRPGAHTLINCACCRQSPLPPMPCTFTLPVQAIGNDLPYTASARTLPQTRLLERNIEQLDLSPANRTDASQLRTGPYLHPHCCRGRRCSRTHKSAKFTTDSARMASRAACPRAAAWAAAAAAAAAALAAPTFPLAAAALAASRRQIQKSCFVRCVLPNHCLHMLVMP